MCGSYIRISMNNLLYIYIYNLINSKLYIVSQYIIENTVPESVYVVKEVKDDSYVLVYFILF